MITIRDMTYRVAGRILFEGANATIPTGHKVGLIGRNGTGKTTLLRLFTGELQTDEGGIEISGLGGIEDPIGVVAQEAPSGEGTALDTVLLADNERARLMVEAETATDPHRVAEIQTRLADIGAHSAPARAARILAGLGFDAEMQISPMSSFSGGWRMRVALAGVLFQEPEILLLDEPTNHLDLEASVWLEAYLKRYPKTLIIVSHDRDLLNSAVDAILHLEGGKLTLYGGPYDTFERVREQRLVLQEAARSKQNLRRKHLMSFVERFRYKASKARQAQSRLKMIERMDMVPEAVVEPTTTFRFPEPEELAPPIITFERTSVGYEAGKPILRGLDLRLDADDRIGLLGPNGNGKTTLARLIAGRLDPMSGDQHRAAKLRIGFFAQHQIEDLDLEGTPIQHLARLMPDVHSDRVRSRLGGVGLIQMRQETKVKFLSGGEKARLTIALITYNNPHLLILDEPTNHLDIDARDALAHALNDYAGAVILISHDRRLLETTVDRLWLVADETVRSFDGDMEEYRDWIRDQRRSGSSERQSKGNGPNENGSKDNGSRKDARRQSAEIRRQTTEFRKRAREAEKLVGKLTSDRERVDARLADPAIYGGPTADLKSLILKKEGIVRRIEEAEADWLTAEEALENATSAQAE